MLTHSVSGPAVGLVASVGVDVLVVRIQPAEGVWSASSWAGSGRRSREPAPEGGGGAAAAVAALLRLLQTSPTRKRQAVAFALSSGAADHGQKKSPTAARVEGAFGIRLGSCSEDDAMDRPAARESRRVA